MHEHPTYMYMYYVFVLIFFPGQIELLEESLSEAQERITQLEGKSDPELVNGKGEYVTCTS